MWRAASRARSRVFPTIDVVHVLDEALHQGEGRRRHFSPSLPPTLSRRRSLARIHLVRRVVDQHVGETRPDSMAILADTAGKVLNHSECYNQTRGL
ncbi:BQ5605_C001g00018 [Microbotryum silenes-dioicae]|uniref:BQ5605_C001g00018 protein n=1 Tax=Microbotryum silenes-dioicae TaxID=796604 RepID=A0A2X0M642_9BASI|nr:BQ5605_C001g00018 [Microbotryum silenes-dioicae]